MLSFGTPGVAGRGGGTGGAGGGWTGATHIQIDRPHDCSSSHSRAYAGEIARLGAFVKWNDLDDVETKISPAWGSNFASARASVRLGIISLFFTEKVSPILDAGTPAGILPPFLLLLRLLCVSRSLPFGHV